MLSDRLSDQHLAMLRASTISDDVIVERKYFTATRKVELGDLGFATSQQLVPALVVPVFGPLGEVVLYQVRPDQPRMRHGKVIKYETPAGSRMTLDVPPRARPLLGNPALPLFVTEGVKKADALASRGLCAVALLGVWNFRGTNEQGGKVALPEWESIALNERQVFVVFDSDVMLKAAVASALARLGDLLTVRGASVAYIYLPAGPSAEKTGVDDYLAAGHNVDDLLALATAERRAMPDDAGAADDPSGGKQADRLVAIGRRAELFHDPQGSPFAGIEAGGHREIWPLGAKQFKRWLRHAFFTEEGNAPGADAVAAALGVLEGIAVYEGAEHTLETRIARHEGAIYYDLSDPAWRAVRIDADGWEIVDRPPPLFRRYSHQAPQVVPEPGGSLNELFRFLNVRPDDRVLLAAWLVAAFIPDIPHPIPNFHGEKGAGKSVGQRALRRLIDPSIAETLAFASDAREIVQQLAHHYAPIYDNQDALAPWLSDLLCRAVTGEGFTKRELYSDDDDVVYAYRRVVLLNGVNVIPQRSDLLDRSILMELMRIPPERRREEREFWAGFEAARPRLLGAIFDALVRAMSIYDRLQLPALQRMADFTRWGAAIAEALGYGAEAFLKAYAANLGVQTREAVEGDIVGAAILSFMEGREEWSGTATELLAALEDAGERAKLFHRNANGKVDARGWPGGAHILSRRLKQLLSNLADLGFALQDGRGDIREITIRRAYQQGEESSDGSDGSVVLERGDQIHPDATDATVAEIVTSGGSTWEAVIR